MDALGLISYNNDEPLTYLNDTNNTHLFNIEVVSDNELIASWRGTSAELPVASYLGAIVSNDRTEVLWVNNTSPLP